MPADLACAICTKRYETGNPGAALQCRALPPVQDVSRDAIYPTVQPDFFCHVYFQADAEAVQARRAAQARAADLDAQVAATQALESAAAQPELALGAEPATPRARRARPAAQG